MPPGSRDPSRRPAKAAASTTPEDSHTGSERRRPSAERDAARPKEQQEQGRLPHRVHQKDQVCHQKGPPPGYKPPPVIKRGKT
eukprot:6487594-Amphidinium_carterae.7